MSSSQRARAYNKLHRAGYRLRTPSVGAGRRIQALCAIGWTQKEIAERLGVAHLTVNRIAAGYWPTIARDLDANIRWLYAELHMQVQRDTAAARLAISWARKNNWAAPLAWDSDEQMDDPEARPCGRGWTQQPYGCSICGEKGSDGKLRRDLCKKHYQREMNAA